MPKGLDDYSPERMRVFMKRAGIGIDLVAVKCGVVIGTARGWAAGRLTPTEVKAVKLAEALGVKIADLTNTPPDKPTLRQLRQWRGLRGEDAAERAGIGITPVYTAETYVSPVPEHVRAALARAYEVPDDEIEAAWQRGRTEKYGGTLA
ncbi:helix-turn-helix transcriptional regulator [Nocardia wallacei]|uniref:helix-turn-helix transcriptional regulator n=1 Tax=Nocardia wallacei TaxID=480035 RepID=UPI0024561404|nr:helix-turn-helix transcriptional regulator [Nocardia wallacei]